MQGYNYSLDQGVLTSICIVHWQHSRNGIVWYSAHAFPRLDYAIMYAIYNYRTTYGTRSVHACPSFTDDFDVSFIQFSFPVYSSVCCVRYLFELLPNFISQNKLLHEAEHL